MLAGGDDIEFNALMGPMLLAERGEGMRFFMRHLAEDLPMHRRVGLVVRAMSDPGMEQRSLSGHCEVASRLASRLGMSESVCHSLGEPRPHRAALAPTEAATQLLDDVDAGQFNRAEVDAVLAAAGQVSLPANVARPASIPTPARRS